MKKLTHLWLDDRGLKAFNAPEQPIFWDNEVWYNKAIQLALAEGVYFKDILMREATEAYRDVTFPNGVIMTLKKHSVYDVPDGYEVMVENDYDEEYGDHNWAILVPKAHQTYTPTKEDGEKIIGFTESGAGDDYPVIPQPKLQSIEEAAEAYAKSKKVRYPDSFEEGIVMGTEDGFIAGAKSDAARVYWYEQFKREQ